MSMPIVRRNRGTLVSAKLPLDVGSSVTLISNKNDMKTLSDDLWVLYVQLSVIGLDSELRFKHSRNGTRKVSVSNRQVSFEMIVESHRTSRRGTVLLELFHKTDETAAKKMATGSLEVEFRSEKGPKDELQFNLQKLKEPQLEDLTKDLAPSAPTSSTVSSRPAKKSTRASSRKNQGTSTSSSSSNDSLFPKPLNARQRKILEEQSESEDSEYEEESDEESLSEASDDESEQESQVPTIQTQPAQKLFDNPTVAVGSLFDNSDQIPVGSLFDNDPVTEVPDSLPNTAPTSPYSSDFLQFVPQRNEFETLFELDN